MIQNLFSSTASMGGVSQGLFQSIQRVGSGQRITQAGDDPAGSAVFSAIQSISRSDRASLRAVNDGMNMAQGIDATAGRIQDNLARLRELAVAAASDTTGQAGRAALNDEVMQLRDEITRVADSTEFNGVQLTNGAQTGLDVQAGASSSDEINLDTPDLTAGALGVAGIDVSTGAGAQAALEAIDAAMKDVSSVRAEAGSQHERLASAIDSSASRIESQAAALSRIGDADYALEVSKNSNLQLQQDVQVAVRVQSQNLTRASTSALLS
jgi:flagellin